MASEKQTSPYISSPENAVPEENSYEEEEGGRSYQCTFCKRGFTNAQALGGHMNIHRKDKAKAKLQKDQIQEEASSMIKNAKPGGDCVSPRHEVSQIASADRQKLGFYMPLEGQRSYHEVYSPHGPNPSNLVAFLSQENMEVDRGESLNLRIGLPSSVEEDVDLELRLGHDP